MKEVYCKLSQRDYRELYEVKEAAKKEKYLERPFAYEFYHQLRELMDCGAVDFGDRVIQAEVDKRYQHYFKKGKIPDFIIHVPDRNNKNFAVLEFKLTSNLSNKDGDYEELNHDFEKLIDFRKCPVNEPLNYEHIVEVIIGNKVSLAQTKKDVKAKFNNAEYKGTIILEEVTVIEFDTDSWKADVWVR